MKMGLAAPLKWLSHRRHIQRWASASGSAAETDLRLLRKQRQDARELRGHLSHLISVADGRLAKPEIGSEHYSVPASANWSWRPSMWAQTYAPIGQVGPLSGAKLDDEISIFHDSKDPALTLRQDRNTAKGDLSPFALRLETFELEGSFLSLVAHFPKFTYSGLSKRSILRMICVLECEAPIEVFARLNLKHGPNTDELIRSIPSGSRINDIDFDLAYTDVNETRVESVWVDLIFENPKMNQITIRDLTFCRFPRAAL